MSGIFGIVRRGRGAVGPSMLETMRCSMARWGPDGGAIWQGGPAGLGQLRLFSTPEARYERLPHADKICGIVFTAAARVDNRAELARLLDISSQEQASLPDSEFLRRAYLQWGELAPERVFGDWAFAAWHPQERRLFLARDHFGNTSLFYYSSPRVFAFASSRQTLLELNLAPVELDELYLAQVLVSWPAYHGERTIHKPIRRLPPAHSLTVTPDRVETRQYWRLENARELRWARREDCVAAFREIFDEAVRCRLRSAEEYPVATTLSGGLDSSAVTATAAALLRDRGRMLAAFTSVPLADTGSYVGERFGDEFPLAEATARFAGNVELFPVAAGNLSPMEGLRRLLEIQNEPGHSAANAYWIFELERAARAHGCRVLLTGQMGNGSVSWTGHLSSQPLAVQLRTLGLAGWANALAKRTRQHLRRELPGLAAALLRHRLERRNWYRLSAIRPDFADRLQLLDRWLSDPHEFPAITPQEKRYQILHPGRSLGGGLHAQMGAAHGLDVRDPTADARVLSFVLSVPDRIFIDPGTGMDRWLIREAMKGCVPDEVRLNRQRGRQAGDLVPRLRACAAEVENALEELSAGPAAEYVDVVYLREVWNMVRTKDTPDAFRKSVTVLCRGIMAGLFVNQFASCRHGAADAFETPEAQLEAVR